MTAYLVASYDITDPATYAKYNPASLEQIMAIVARHGGRVLAAGADADWLGEARRDALVLLEFPSREAAMAWHEDPDYVPLRALRLASTTNIFGCVIDAAPAPQ